MLSIKTRDSAHCLEIGIGSLKTAGSVNRISVGMQYGPCVFARASFSTKSFPLPPLRPLPSLKKGPKPAQNHQGPTSLQPPESPAPVPRGDPVLWGAADAAAPAAQRSGGRGAAEDTSGHEKKFAPSGWVSVGNGPPTTASFRLVNYDSPRCLA